MNEIIRILLVDDHALFRSGVKSLLSRYPQFEIIGEAADGAEGVKRVQQLRPDVVLLDLNMPGLSGIEALQLILQEFPATVVLMLTVSEDSEDLRKALAAGAKGYLLKNIDTEYLVRAVERAARGIPVIDDAMTGALVAQLIQGSSPTKESGLDKLTPRELEVLSGIAKGQSNKEIARHLFLAESTVKIHVQNILKKLDLTSRVQAALYAVEKKLELP